MSNSPDLPEWLKYTYDGYTSTGYIYGVPPLRLVTLNLDVVGWNRYINYDARQLVISLEIMRKEPVEYIMEMKIDNLNIRDLCLPRKMNELKSVLAEHLGWTQKNGNRVVPVYMASAVDIGENRVPVRPNEAEGVVIYFASDKDFSQPLKKLQVEISPLWRLRPCPRDMKRTSVERHFRRYNFLVDWCSFRLTSQGGGQAGPDDKKGMSKNSSPNNNNAGSTGNSDFVDETMDFVEGKGRFTILPEVFQFQSEISERTCGYEALLATIVPGSIGGLIGILLIALLWADREEESVDGDRLFFEAAFRMLFSIIRYGNGNGTATYDYHQITRQQQQQDDANATLLTRDRDAPIILKTDSEPSHHGPPTSGGQMMMDDDIMAPPILPPQYSETHPNGAPALIYAV